ncbi:acyl carrier protein [Streptomyces noursei]|uniref:acyl carrier protein n=1 Tax=Streptomyces noursei TaxID=1971 RepID=UPI0023B777BC|nr:acyl carrier protein [Streptomyces noursei]
MTRPTFTFDDLKEILREGAGADPETLAETSLDATFGDLGFESLALLETLGRIERQYDLALDDAAFTGATTPRALIDLVNEQLNSAAA